MPRITWNGAGKRITESGVDRGVLYVEPFPGVAWNGLVQVSESPVGGDALELFIDGEKYQDLMLPEEFSATITAFSSPGEFASCAGFVKLSPGLLAGGQPRRRFGFSYRSMIFGDLDPSGLGYKIHLVYNAVAGGADVTRESSGEKPNVKPYSWDIITTPETTQSSNPSAHFVIDSRKTDPGVLSDIEDILYGTTGSDPRLMTPLELITMVPL